MVLSVVRRCSWTCYLKVDVIHGNKFAKIYMGDLFLIVEERILFTM